MELDEVILPTAVENLSILPSGILPSDAVGILNSQRMSDMIAELKLRYDIIFFDSPPMLGVSDASVLASEVDQTIIVVLAHALKPSDLFPPLEGIVLVLVTAAACFLSYEAIRRVPLLRPLFGLDNAARKPATRLDSRPSRPAQYLGSRFSVPQDIN